MFGFQTAENVFLLCVKSKEKLLSATMVYTRLMVKEQLKSD